VLGPHRAAGDRAAVERGGVVRGHGGVVVSAEVVDQAHRGDGVAGVEQRAEHLDHAVRHVGVHHELAADHRAGHVVERQRDVAQVGERYRAAGAPRRGHP